MYMAAAAAAVLAKLGMQTVIQRRVMVVTGFHVLSRERVFTTEEAEAGIEVVPRARAVEAARAAVATMDMPVRMALEGVVAEIRLAARACSSCVTGCNPRA